MERLSVCIYIFEDVIKRMGRNEKPPTVVLRI